MKFTFVSVLALALLGFAGFAKADQTKPGVTVGETKSVTATITKIDKKSREITLKGPDGNEVIVYAGPEVKRFDEIKKGDEVNVEYSQALALYVRKTDEPLSHEESTAIERASKSQSPGVTATKVTKVTAEVEAIDYATRVISLRGPRGGVMTFKVGEDVKKFNEIKKGDKVVANYSEALAINIVPTKK